MLKFVKYSILFFITIVMNIDAQTSNRNCDSLYQIYTADKGFIAIEQSPIPKKSFKEIQKEIISQIDTNLAFKTIYVTMLVDTLGRVICPYILKGNNNFIDTLVLNYLSNLEFFPAINRGKKVECQFSVPIRGNFFNKQKTNKSQN